MSCCVTWSLSAVVGRRNGEHIPRVRDDGYARQKVGDLWRPDRRRLDWEHEHRAWRQQEVVSDERGSDTDDSGHESHLWNHGSLAGFSTSIILTALIALQAHLQICRLPCHKGSYFTPKHHQKMLGLSLKYKKLLAVLRPKSHWGSLRRCLRLPSRIEPLGAFGTSTHAPRTFGACLLILDLSPPLLRYDGQLILSSS